MRVPVCSPQQPFSSIISQSHAKVSPYISSLLEIMYYNCSIPLSQYIYNATRNEHSGFHNDRSHKYLEEVNYY